MRNVVDLREVLLEIPKFAIGFFLLAPCCSIHSLTMNIEAS